MCAIVDVNVAPEVFGDNPPPVAEKFFEWLERGGGRLVVGGKLLEELEENSPDFRRLQTLGAGGPACWKNDNRE